MVRARSPRSTGSSMWRRVAAACAAGLVLAPLGCCMSMSSLDDLGPRVPGPIAYVAAPPSAAPWQPPILRPSAGMLPSASASPGQAPTASQGVRPASHVSAAPAVLPQVLPINLDTVLQLTRQRNTEIARAREQVHEAEIIYQAACEACMPNALRKSDYKTTNAEANLWQQRAQFAKTQTRVLEEAGNTYFDWLTMRQGEREARQLREYDVKVLKRAEGFYNEGKGNKSFKGQVDSGRAAVAAHDLLIAELHRNGDGYAAKLAYLLNVDAAALASVEPQLNPVDVVDASLPLEQLTAQARENGPAVRELEGLIASIETTLGKATMARRLCDCTGAPLICGRLHAGESKLQQAQLTLADARGKLTAGVSEARSSILIGRERISRSATYVKEAQAAYDHASDRLEATDETRAELLMTEVFSRIKVLTDAHTAHLTAINQHNKAQVRLLLYLGTFGVCAPAAP